MRCPSCNRFPGFDVADPETSLDLVDGTLTGTVRLCLTTACCGEEAKETNFDIDIDMTQEFTDALVAAGLTEPEGGFDFSTMVFGIEEEAAMADDRYETKDKRGKVITNPRYRRHFYCIDLEITGRCTFTIGGARPDALPVAEVSGESISVTATVKFHDEIQANCIEEL